MRPKSLISAAAALVAVATLAASCIRDEAANAEADILTAQLDGAELLQAPVVTNDNVTFYTDDWMHPTHLAPTFTITPGATIEPASGTALDFTRPQRYTVTSEDGRWKKVYTVEFPSTDVKTEYGFENIKWYEYANDEDEEPMRFFHIFYDENSNGDQMEWGSGNAGFMMTAYGKPATDYPTYQADGGKEGKCLALVTRSTGQLGAMFGAPIAAGNLFMGTFATDITNPARSTHFGIPFRRVPLALTGWYKYKAGQQMTDRDGKAVDERDQPDIYAIMFLGEVKKDADGNPITDMEGNQQDWVDGTEAKTDPRIVSIAQVEGMGERDEWTQFVAEFRPVKGADGVERQIDPKLLREGRYKFAIIMTSSIHGATFRAAVGSTLMVDELNLYCDQTDADHTNTDKQ